jgi:hypothetical protein
MQLLLRRVECREHPRVFYDPTREGCPECESEKIEDVEDRLDEEEMVWVNRRI